MQLLKIHTLKPVCHIFDCLSNNMVFSFCSTLQIFLIKKCIFLISQFILHKCFKKVHLKLSQTVLISSIPFFRNLLFPFDPLWLFFERKKSESVIVKLSSKFIKDSIMEQQGQALSEKALIALQRRIYSVFHMRVCSGKSPTGQRDLICSTLIKTNF